MKPVPLLSNLQLPSLDNNTDAKNVNTNSCVRVLLRAQIVSHLFAEKTPLITVTLADIIKWGQQRLLDDRQLEEA
jgi:hypothetical protein